MKNVPTKNSTIVSTNIKEQSSSNSSKPEQAISSKTNQGIDSSSVERNNHSVVTLTPQLDNQGKETTQGFNYSLTDHRAKVASLKAVINPADVYCKELLVPLQSDIQLPIRIYRPKNKIGPLPTFFYVPGTGFVTWETAFTHVICSHIAEKGDCQVIAITHRVAPENKFSAGYKLVLKIAKL